MTISNFSIEYDAINPQNTFTNGDTIKGRIVVVASKETKIQWLAVIAKGKGEAHSTNEDSSFSVYETYYNIRQIISEDARLDGDTFPTIKVIGQGRHLFPFCFKIPDRGLPSSIKCSLCTIVYKLKAELKQSGKLLKKADEYFKFVSKPALEICGLTAPRHGFKQTSVKLFGSGTVTMDVYTDRLGYKQGEIVQIRAEVRNQSTRLATPIILFYLTQTSFGNGLQSGVEKKLLKMEANPVASGSKDTIIKKIKIPGKLPPSILNCSIFKMEYQIRVYLDMKYTEDHGITIPLIVLPGVPQQSSAAFEGAASGNPNYPTWSSTPQPLEPPPPYEELFPSSTDSDNDKNAVFLQVRDW
ncbi:arrestin domain-containing protein 3-like isoform X2 [Nerophis lumbriciformis]|uniref:arrestin domain-containing protein 3-like isoform X2 n=1 Tax=Nerophis lumbriciformis TaxID=546530 RepID=UPI002AE09435|nr:arrestin domain-containing protein 3-like isoform X2 [Nerophis lumbriciformis]